MNLGINFTFSSEKTRIWALYIMACLFILTVTLAGLSVSDSKRMKTGIPGIQKELETRELEYKTIKGKYILPETDKLEALARRISSVNKMKMKKSAGLTELLYALEKITPAQIVLTAFEYDQETNEIILQARAMSPDMVSKYAALLGAEPCFAGVVVEKQVQKESSSGVQLTDFVIRAQENIR